MTLEARKLSYILPCSGYGMIYSIVVMLVIVTVFHIIKQEH